MAIATQDDLKGAYVRAAVVDTLPAPAATTGAVGWMRANLFSSWTNVALTIISALLVYWIVPPIEFMLTHAVGGADREVCLPTAERPDVGACWPFVRDASHFIYGSYPIPERWRVDVFFAMLASRHRLAVVARRRRARDLGALYLFVVVPVVSYALLSGMPRSAAAHGRYLALGRRAGHDRGSWVGHRVLAAGRHPAGARAALAHASP
jgi:general L-amino acid transport system permease protein